MDIQDDMNDNVVDLVEYRLMKELDTYSPGTADWEAIMSVLDLYLSGVVTIRWTNDDIMIKIKEGADADAVEHLFPKNLKEEEIT